MIISDSDKAALKVPDVLHAYCRAVLGAGKQVGRLMFYPCPWGAHSRPKLEVSERDGVGVAMCRACDCGGTVYDVIRHVVEEYDYPLCFGFPVGHSSRCYPMPMGDVAELEVGAGGVSLNYIP